MDVDPVSQTSKTNVFHKTTSKIASFAKKITDLLRSFFRVIGEFFTHLGKNQEKPYQLTPQERKNAKDAARAFRLSEITHEKRDQSIDQLPSSSREIEAQNQIIQEKTIPPIENPAMNTLHHATEVFCEKVFDCCADKIQPAIEGSEEGLRWFTKHFHTVTKKVVGAGGQTVQFLHSLLLQHLDNYAIPDKLIDEFEGPLQWLLRNDPSSEESDKISEETLIAALENSAELKAHFSDSQLQVYFKPVVNWLLGDDHSKTLLSVFRESEVLVDDNGIKSEEKQKIDAILQEALLFLLDRKIKIFNEYYQDQLNKPELNESKLSQAVRDIIVKNGTKIASLLARRFTVILEHAEFAEMFDSLIQIALKQTRAIIASEEKRRPQDFEKIIFKGEEFEGETTETSELTEEQKADKETTKTILQFAREYEEIRQKRRSEFTRLIRDNALLEQELKRQDELNKIPQEQLTGKEKAEKLTCKQLQKKQAEYSLLQDKLKVEREYEKENKMKWTDQATELTARNAYANYGSKDQPFCHPLIEKMLRDTEMSWRKKETITDKIFEPLVEEIIRLLIPEKSEDNKSDGLGFLCSQFKLPGLFKTLKDDILNVVNGFAGPNAHELLETSQRTIRQMEKELKHLISKATFDVARKLLKAAMTYSVRKMIEPIVDPTSLNYLVGKYALPTIQEQIVIAMLRQTISGNLDWVSKLYIDQLKLSEKPKAKKIKAIFSKIHPPLKNAFQEYHEFENNEEKLLKLLSPELEEIEKAITDHFTSQNLSFDTEDASKIAKAVIQNHYKDPESKTNQAYGELIENLLIKLGHFDFNSWFVKKGFPLLNKKVITPQMSAAMEEIRRSPDFLAIEIAKQINTQYATKESVKELLFNETPELDKQQVKDKLEVEIQKTAQVAYDCIFLAVSQLGWGWKHLATRSCKAALSDNSAKLAKVIARIYGKTFGSSLMNTNLLFRCQEVIMRTLVASNQNLSKQGRTSYLKLKEITELPQEPNEAVA